MIDHDRILRRARTPWRYNYQGLVVDGFAGGGGASRGMELAGLRVDIAINHDAEAIAMHKLNHPRARHFHADIYTVDPREATAGRPVWVAWFSPDCKHFSKAKGGRPVSRRIRSLAWRVVTWARETRPWIIFVENVEEFVTWGPLGPDGKPDPNHKGVTFQEWVADLRRLGYAVEWREMRACEYGAPTIRRRLFVIARRDGVPIVWPEPSHGPGRARPYRTAAECIDFSIPVQSIFGRKKELAEATLRRIARGVQRYVLGSSKPFLVPGQLALVSPQCAPFLVPRYNEHSTQSPRCRSLQEPLPTVVPTGNGGALVAAFLAQHNTGATGHPVEEPVSTICQSGTHQQLVTSNLLKLRNNCVGQHLEEPLHTITGGGEHFAEVRAFLLKFYRTGEGQLLGEPIHTVTTKDRFGLVTINGQLHQIVDIGMRMLTPRELFRAQGFGDDYQIEPLVPNRRGRLVPLSKTAQIRCCGNSVSPQAAAALIRANVPMETGLEVAS